MKHEEEMILSRSDIADRLRDLADAIAAGSVTVGGMQAAIPEIATLELELTRNKLEIEIDWKRKAQ